MKIVDRIVSAYAESEASVAAANAAGIWVCHPYIRGVQTVDGIEALAAEAGAEVTIEPYNDDQYPAEKTFTYHGVKFFESVAQRC